MKIDLEEKTIEVEKIFEGKVLDLEVHTVTLPNGETSTRELINHRGAVAILALTKDDEVILVEQYRKAIEAVTLEIPAGKLEPGEDNKKLAAIRELQEETGYVIEEEKLEKLCDVHVALGYSSELITIYYVDNLEYAGEQNPDDDEFINLRKYKVEEAFKLLDNNVITDSKTMLALAYLKNRKGAKKCMSIYDEIIKIIQKSPYKLTPQREKIVEILVENEDKHLSAEELYFILKEKTPDIGIATVYRTLDIFFLLFILEKISFSNGVSKYHLRQSVDDELHHHLICTNCNSIEKVSNPIFNKLIEYMKKEYSFEVQDNSLSFYGTCANCKNKGEN